MDKKYLKEYKSFLTPRLAMLEASRCLLCVDALCSSSCPAGTDPAKFIRSLRFRNIKGAAETIRINNILGGICARVCPTERYCQSGCSRSGIDKPIDIAGLQLYLTNYESATKMDILEKRPLNGKKVAIIGSGPSGLTAAGSLAMEGFEVTVFEKEKKAGGYLRYGIPEYRLPNRVVDEEIARIEKLGVAFKFNELINNERLNDLKEKFDAVIVAIGYSKGKMLDMFKNNKRAVLAVDLLKKIKERKGNIKVPENVIVIGGGDVSMDVLVSLKMLGSRFVSAVVYETFEEFKASRDELRMAQDMGVSIFDGYIPISTSKGGVVKFKHRFLNNELKLKGDLIVLAVGQTLELNDMDIKMLKNEVYADNYHIKGSNVFFAGDIAHGDKTVVYGVKTGKEVAHQVMDFVK